ncbi:Hypothetical_protein [Hexamita inflata]|uniref:Hypothetical_protein n=1 Tax=Hexamita inflata TaxID=28002 RepID=A0AA86RB72_9EUKA|nr:Hypothetical protein HINF_LOCUS62854 [Hexamita inflata]
MQIYFLKTKSSYWLAHSFFEQELILDSNVINILDPDITRNMFKDLKQFSKNIISNIVVEVAYEGPSPSNIVLGPTHNSDLQQRLAFIIEAAKFNMVKAKLFFVQLM